MEFPTELIGKKVLLATESLGPVNGVSRTTQSLVDYLRAHEVQVATCAPEYVGQHINARDSSQHARGPMINAEWLRSVEAKGALLGSRALGGAWSYHNPKCDEQARLQGSTTRTDGREKNPPIFTSSRATETYTKFATRKQACRNPDFRLKGCPLPYNPDLTVAYPFRLGVVYEKTFVPDVIYLASPASVGFQVLIQLNQLERPTPTLLNFQTDLSAYSTILFRAPIDKYAVWMLQGVQGYLFRTPAVRTIFYPSAYVRKYMENAGAPSDKMIQLGRGVDTESFKPSYRDHAYRKQIAPNGEIILCCICRLAPEKGFEFLATGARRLSASGLRFKLLIVGGNKNPAVENEVRGYFDDLGSQVIFTGTLRGDALSGAYASADIFLHCSITETFGLVVLESMASGVPVIARDEGGPSETVKHGSSGFLVAPHDLDTFVKLAYRLSHDEPLRKGMAVQARQQALETTWDKINNQVAMQLALALRDQPAVEEGGSYYGSWQAVVRVYLAVGLVRSFGLSL